MGPGPAPTPSKLWAPRGVSMLPLLCKEEDMAILAWVCLAGGRSWCLPGQGAAGSAGQRQHHLLCSGAVCGAGGSGFGLGGRWDPPPLGCDWGCRGAVGLCKPPVAWGRVTGISGSQRCRWLRALGNARHHHSSALSTALGKTASCVPQNLACMSVELYELHHSSASLFLPRGWGN